MARILLVSSRYRPPNFRGGTERYLHVLGTAFGRLGHDCRIVALEEALPCESAVPHTFIKVPRIPFLRPMLFGLAGRRLWRAADLISVQYAPFGALIPKDKLICTVHTTGYGELQALKAASGRGPLRWWHFIHRIVNMPVERFVYSRAQHIIAISQQIADELVDLYGIPRERITVVGTGVDCDEFFPSSEIKGRTPLRLLYVGRLAARKNVDLLIRAVAKCTVDVQLRITGTGPEQGRLETLTASLGLQDRVSFRGFRKGHDLLAEYQWADMLVMPSSYEGLPLAALEAKATGLVIVATNFPGAAKIISAESGWIVGEATAESLALALEEGARDSIRLNRMAACARLEAVEKFSWDTVVTALAGQYCAVIDRAAV